MFFVFSGYVLTLFVLGFSQKVRFIQLFFEKRNFVWEKKNDVNLKSFKINKLFFFPFEITKSWKSWTSTLNKKLNNNKRKLYKHSNQRSPLSLRQSNSFRYYGLSVPDGTSDNVLKRKREITEKSSDEQWNKKVVNNLITIYHKNAEATYS
jgi:hypothetical protein